MRVWKLTPLFFLIFGVVACTSKPAEESAATPTDTTASAEPSTPEPVPAPVPEPVPAAPVPSKPAKTAAKPAAAPKPEAKPAAPVANEPAPVPVARDVAPAPAPAAAPVPAPAPPPPPKPVIVPAGTELNAILTDPLNSGKNKVGDEFSANLAAPIYVNGGTILERGAKLQGQVVAVDGAGRVSGKATMAVALTGVMYKGKMVPIATKDFAAEAESSKGRDAGMIGGGAGLGAIIGAIAGGGKGAAIGAAVGGAGGTGAVLATKGKEVDFPAEFKLTFTLDKDLSVMP
jgi:hypothetical protein